MDARAYFADLARYNLWANDRLLTALEPLDDSDWHADLGLFFRSLHGTFNHLLLAEEIWLGRLTGRPTSHTDLAAELEADRKALRVRLRATDQAAIDAMRALPEPLPERLDFVTTKGLAMSLPMQPVLAHVFNHATHHRGQATTAAHRLGLRVQELDIPYFVLDTGS